MCSHPISVHTPFLVWMSGVELTIENFTINHLRTGFAWAVLAQLTFETWRLMYHWGQRKMEEQHSWNQECRDVLSGWGWPAGDTAQLLIFTCSDVLTGVYWGKLHQFFTLVQKAEATGDRKRLSYTLGRMQNGSGYQLAVWLNRTWFVVRVINSRFQYSLPRVGCEQNHGSKTFVLKCEMNLGQENEFYTWLTCLWRGNLLTMTWSWHLECNSLMHTPPFHGPNSTQGVVKGSER